MKNASTSRTVKTAAAVVAMIVFGLAATQTQAQSYSGGYYGGGGYQGGYYGGGGYQGGYYGRGPTVNVNRTIRIQVPRYYPNRYVPYGGRAGYVPYGYGSGNYNGYRTGYYRRNNY